VDGATFSVVVPEQARVAEIKRAIATLREMACFTMELFVKDAEDPLGDERRVGLRPSSESGMIKDVIV
jgi:hypothetical protein